MNKLPHYFKSIEGSKITHGIDTKDEKGLKVYCRYVNYTINKGLEDEIVINVKLPNITRPEISNKVIDDANKFVNGFKVVQMENGEYAYVLANFNKVLPFRYDIATNFNDYGLAMVGKDGKVSWINEDFEYLSKEGNFIKETSSYREFDGFMKMYDFSIGEIPLSRLVGYNHLNTSYLSTDGKLKVFHNYDGNILSDATNNYFKNGKDFNELGYVINEEEVLFAQGYYCTLKDLIAIFDESGLISKLNDDISKQYQKKLIK